MYIDSIDTPIGMLYARANKEYLLYVKWNKPLENVNLRKQKHNGKILQRLRMQINEYFKGKRKNFDLPAKIEGTIFQKKIWKTISDIPFGAFLSYAQLAKKVGSPKASRAAGTACGANQFCIVIPCHRIISSNMTLGGYGGGLRKKKWLLDLEESLPGDIH